MNILGYRFNTIIKSLLLLVTVLTVGCSQITRTSDPGVTDEEMIAGLYQIFDDQNSIQNANGTNYFLTLVEDPDSAIYYTESGNYSSGEEPFGSVDSVLSIVDVEGDQPGGLGFLISQYYKTDIDSVRIYFIDLNVEEDGQEIRENALLFDFVMYDGQTMTKTFYQYGDQIFGSGVDNDEMSVVLFDGDGAELRVSTKDLEEGRTSLTATIQLKLEIRNSNGGGAFEYLGKIPVMSGFGN